MTGNRRRHEGKSALELIDEAVHLLRRAPCIALAGYYLGSVPFVLGLLYFWADMSRSGLAEERCAPASLIVAALFLWMKWWQVWFAQQLKVAVAGARATRWSWSSVGTVAMLQTILQPAGLFILPLALLVTLPFGWVYAFYQNVTVLSGAAERDLKDLVKRAAQQAQLWPTQNHLLLLIISAFGFFVLLNVALGAVTLPQLVQMLFGVELTFLRSRAHVLNTTFLAVVTGVTYLCLDPVVKAVYVLRCFYGDSLRSGHDLRAELKGCLVNQKIPAALLMTALFFSTATFLNGTPQAPDSPPGLSEAPGKPNRVSSVELDRSISQVLNQREFSWRLPRENKAAQTGRTQGVLANFLEGIAITLKSWIRSVETFLENAMEWLARKLSRWLGDPQRLERSDTDWLSLSKWLLSALLAVATGVLAIALWRSWRKRRHRHEAFLAQAVAAIPDLADENIMADQLPEDEWLQLARERMTQGDLRSAVRALFLASLAHLARRQMITLARFKSNREYDQEVSRRARAWPDLQAAFSQNVTIYDRVWYGLHEVSPELVDGFSSNLERIKAC